MPLLSALIKYCLDKNLFVLVTLILIATICVYGLFMFKEMERRRERAEDDIRKDQALENQTNGFRYELIGKDLKIIREGVGDLKETVGEHSEKIIALETVQNKWDKILETKYQKEGTKDAS